MTTPKTWNCREGITYDDETGENGRLLAAAHGLLSALLDCREAFRDTAERSGAITMSADHIVEISQEKL